jgi:hypothetical protein
MMVGVTDLCIYRRLMLIRLSLCLIPKLSEPVLVTFLYWYSQGNQSVSVFSEAPLDKKLVCDREHQSH